MAIIDLTGQKIGRWTVLYLLDERTKKRGTLWHCRCECGIEKDVPGETLRSGQSRSCGCLQKEIASQNGKNCAIDITGQRFGKLVALERIPSKDKNKHTNWKCQCDCGNIAYIDLGNLMSGKSQSCGCTSSSQEENITKLLIEHGINYKYHYTFPDLPNKKFDFYVDEKYIIEFDGQQHFVYSQYGWSTKEKLIRTHKNDLIKNKYCFNNNIPIIRIPYNRPYVYDDLILETTRFLLLKENEKEYYRLDPEIEQASLVENIRYNKPSTNTSGFPGVSFNKKNKKWVAYITVNKKQIFLGSFIKKEDAINARLEAEITYLGHYKYKD